MASASVHTATTASCASAELKIEALWRATGGYHVSVAINRALPFDTYRFKANSLENKCVCIMDSWLIGWRTRTRELGGNQR